MTTKTMKRSGFTLIELLVVIAIVAVLAVVVVLVLNPAQLIQQSRDSNRISDMASLNSALSFYLADAGTNGTVNLGSANTVYVSVPDPTATTTAGDQCQGLGLPSLPATYTYHCAASSTFRLANATGWLPVNFAGMSNGSPLGQLPIDPTNSTSSRRYYTYTTNGGQYEVTMVPESSKYKLGGSGDIITGDSGMLATVFEKGSKLGLEPLDYGDSNLVGYWPLNEGSGTVAYDWSGDNATGSFGGSPVWQSGGACVLQSCLDFPTGNNVVNVPASSPFNIPNTLTITLWLKPNTLNVNNTFHAISKWTGTTDANWVLYYCGGACGSNNEYNWDANRGGVWGGITPLSQVSPTSTWIQLGIVYTAGAGGQFYWNGTPTGALGAGGVLATSTAGIVIGNDGSSGNDVSMNSVRIYNRALSAAEMQALYNGGK